VSQEKQMTSFASSIRVPSLGGRAREVANEPQAALAELIGLSPFGGQGAAAAVASELAPAERGAIEDRKAARVLTHRIGGVSKRARSRIHRLERQLWMTGAQLPHGST